MEIRRGIVKTFDAPSYTATVQLVGSLSVWLSGIPVVRNIPTAELVVGRSCAVIFFDPTNPKDAVIFGVWQ